MSETGRLRRSVMALAAVSALQAIFSIALLPIATLVLAAEDFGTYALLMSLVALAVGLADGGGALALPAHFGLAQDQDRGRMIASFAALSGLIGVVLALVLVALWPFKEAIASHFGITVSTSILLACAALVPLRALSATATVVFSVSGRGMLIATQLVVQAFGAFITTVMALLLLDLGLLSLFLGPLVGQSLGLLIVGIALRGDLAHAPSRRWCAIALAHAPTAAMASLVDGARGLAENALIASASGLQEVGYYAHARLYYSLGITASNSVAHNLWSISLGEARDADHRFLRTGRIWEGVHLGVFLAGSATVALGDEVIALLTNNVLTPAAAYLPWLFVLLLINLSGRAAQATLFAVDLGATVTRVRTGIAVFTLILLPLVITDTGGIGLSLGIAGLIGASIVEVSVYRMYLRRRAVAFGNLPFQDLWVLVGVVGIGGAVLLDTALTPTLTQECLMLLLITIIALCVDWSRGGLVRAIVGLRRVRA